MPTSAQVTTGVRDGDRGQLSPLPPPPPPLKIGENIFQGKNYVKFRHFVKFSYIYFGGKMLPPPKLTELRVQRHKMGI